MTGAIRVMPWPDPVLDAIGHDPRSWYVETFWLPTLGPTALLLLRHLADRFEHEPQGRRPAGRRHRGRARARSTRGSAVAADPQPHPPAAVRARLLRRRRHDRGAQTLPPVHRRHVRRLPIGLQARHAEWVEEQATKPVDVARRRARRFALDAHRAGRADRLGRARAARRRLPSRARARGRALGARAGRGRSTSRRCPRHS